MVERSKKTAAGKGTPQEFRLTVIDRQWLEAVCDLEALCYPRPWSRESLAYALDGGYRCVGVIGPQKLAGYLMYSRVTDEVHILNVAVHPDYRGQKVATNLMQWVHEREKRDGAKVAFLEVNRTNLAAQKLYAKFGYQQIGTRKAYYQDDKEDALVLSTAL